MMNFLSQEEIIMTTNEIGFPKKEANPSRNQKPIDSKSLLGQSNYLEIAHEGEIYRLRVTKLKKLILTK
jgi:hemin uptake protein HemP